MPVDRDSADSYKPLIGKAAWIPPLCGFIASVLAAAIGRLTHFEYRREVTMGVFYVVMILVGGHYNGRLVRQPASVIGLAVLLGAVGAAIMHW